MYLFFCLTISLPKACLENSSYSVIVKGTINETTLLGEEQEEYKKAGVWTPYYLPSPP